MAYGAILNQKAEPGMSAEIILGLDSDDYTSFTATSPSGKQYNGSIVDEQWVITGLVEYGEYSVVAQGSAAYSDTVNVTVCQQYIFPITNPILNDNTWKGISFIAQKGLGSSFWAVGDAKQITINATIGTKSYSNYQPWVYILGFNHNATYEGNNTIHFGCFQSTQTYSVNGGIALDDSNYGNPTSTTLAFHMNTTDTNSGGWQSSIMRQQVLDSDASSATSGSSNSFLAALPYDLQAVLKQCTKYTNNAGNSSAQSAVTATQDWVFLLSEYEVQGSITYANTYEQNYQQQYQYYANGNSKVKYRQSATGEAAWWNRSPRASFSDIFCFVSTGGSAAYSSASDSYGLAPGFCV